MNKMLIQIKTNSPNLMGSNLVGIAWDQKNLSQSKITLGMELCDGSLHDLIVKKKADDTTDQAWKLDVIKQMGQAVHPLHSIPVYSFIQTRKVPHTGEVGEAHQLWMIRVWHIFGIN